MTRNISKLVVIIFSKIISNYTLQRYLNYLRVTWEVQYITFSTSSIMSIECFGYSARIKPGHSEDELVDYLVELHKERLKKFGQPLVYLKPWTCQSEWSAQESNRWVEILYRWMETTQLNFNLQQISRKSELFNLFI